MRTPRVHTDQPLTAGQTLALEAGPARHVVQVLRRRAGDALVLFNGDGREYPAHIVALEGKRVRVETGPASSPARESPLDIHLGQAVSRGERMDYTLQKAVELGVSRITPLWSRRTQVKLEGRRLDRRLAHWRGVIVAACEQSGRVRVPELAPPLDLAAWCRARRSDQLGLVLDPAAEAGLRSLDGRGGGILLLSGPEGGLEPEEIDRALAAGFSGVRLGPRVLRTETAAVAALSALQLLWGDFR